MGDHVLQKPLLAVGTYWDSIQCHVFKICVSHYATVSNAGVSTGVSVHSQYCTALYVPVRVPHATLQLCYFLSFE